MGKKVLVVDDDKNAVKFLSAVLSENGYEPVAAYDGREGLEKVEQNGIDLIVLDVMMPKKTGFVLFKELRRKDEYKDVPILMLSAVAASLAEGSVTAELQGDDLAALNRFVAEKGVYLSHLALEERSLEDVFIELTGAETGEHEVPE